MREAKVWQGLKPGMQVELQVGSIVELPEIGERVSISSLLGWNYIGKWTTDLHEGRVISIDCPTCHYCVQIDDPQADVC